MSHRDPASVRVLAPRHLAYIVVGLLPLSFWSCDLLDATNLDINSVGGSSGSAGSSAGSSGSNGGTMGGSGGSGGSTAGSSGSANAGTGGSSGSSGGGSAGTGGSSGSSGSAGTGGTGGSAEDPDGGVDAAVPDSGGGNTSTFNCAGGDSACALCEVWTQLVDCQPGVGCPDQQLNAMTGTGCEAEYTPYLNCYAAEPVTSSVCTDGNPGTRLANPDLGGTGTENNCQLEECALYECLLMMDLSGCP